MLEGSARFSWENAKILSTGMLCQTQTVVMICQCCLPTRPRPCLDTRLPLVKPPTTLRKSWYHIHSNLVLKTEAVLSTIIHYYNRPVAIYRLSRHCVSVILLAKSLVLCMHVVSIELTWLRQLFERSCTHSNRPEIKSLFQVLSRNRCIIVTSKLSQHPLCNAVLPYQLRKLRFVCSSFGDCALQILDVLAVGSPYGSSSS